MEIPKTIHCVWVGPTPLPSFEKKCIQSWKKYMPDCEIRLWNEQTFDINSNQYCREAYAAKKYAFVSDYIRIAVLYKYGGIYMDTDVQVLKPLDRFLSCGHQPFMEKLLHDYDDRSFLDANGKPNLTTNVTYITDACVAAGLRLDNTLQTVEGFTLYPSEYFCPKDWLTREVHLTENSHAIHHFDGSWADGKTRAKNRLMHLAGPKGVRLAKKILGRG